MSLLSLLLRRARGLCVTISPSCSIVNIRRTCSIMPCKNSDYTTETFSARPVVVVFWLYSEIAAESETISLVITRNVLRIKKHLVPRMSTVARFVEYVFSRNDSWWDMEHHFRRRQRYKPGLRIKIPLLDTKSVQLT